MVAQSTPVSVPCFLYTQRHIYNTVHHSRVLIGVDPEGVGDGGVGGLS